MQATSKDPAPGAPGPEDAHATSLDATSVHAISIIDAVIDKHSPAIANRRPGMFNRYTEICTRSWINIFSEVLIELTPNQRRQVLETTLCKNGPEPALPEEIKELLKQALANSLDNGNPIAESNRFRHTVGDAEVMAYDDLVKAGVTSGHLKEISQKAKAKLQNNARGNAASASAQRYPCLVPGCNQNPYSSKKWWRKHMDGKHPQYERQTNQGSNERKPRDTVAPQATFTGGSVSHAFDPMQRNLQMHASTDPQYQEGVLEGEVQEGIFGLVSHQNWGEHDSSIYTDYSGEP